MLGHHKIFRSCYTHMMPFQVRKWVESLVLRPYPKVFDKHRFVYIHIPKTGGKSVSRMLGVTRTVHLGVRDYEILLGEKINEYTFLATVRDPIQRFISAWNYILQGGNGSKENLLRRDILNSYGDINSFILEGVESSGLINHNFFRSQVSFIKNDSGHIDDSVTIIKVENLSEVSSVIPPDMLVSSAVPHINQSSKSYILLTASGLKRLAEIYENDYEKLGYELPTSNKMAV